MAGLVMINPYISLQAFKDSLQETRDVTDAEYERAIEAASRWIDSRCQRHFWREPTPVARLYRATTLALVRTHDFADTTGMIVELDVSSNGTWTTMPVDEWQPEPFSPVNGWPYDRITAAASTVFRVSGRRPAVRVTARWGWAAIPKPVEQACQILAVAYVRAKDITGNNTGFETDAATPMNPLELAEHLLDEFLSPGDRRRDFERTTGVALQTTS